MDYKCRTKKIQMEIYKQRMSSNLEESIILFVFHINLSTLNY